jgi:CheY-like chemotaxis protein
LAIVKRLVELMDGEVALSSEPGKGSEFSVRIRVQADASVEPPQAVEPSHDTTQTHMNGAQHPEHTASILVVDDNEINRMVAVEHLYVLGYHADTASNGAEAVEAVSSRSYALVLMDCQMPVMDGYTAARTIREREQALGLPRLPIIALTAHVLDGEREHVQASGMDEHMPKPIHPHTLHTLLRQFLGSNRPGKAAARDGGTPRAAAESTGSPQLQQSLPSVPANQQQDELPAVLECSASIAGLFLRLAPGQLSELSAAVAERDLKRARDQAHKFKGALYSVSATGLATTVETLRTELASEDWSAIQVRLSEVERRFAVLCAELKKRSASTGT